jgi:hypothetical protein
MKKIRFWNLTLLFLTAVSTLPADAQKGITIQVTASPGFTMGGKYEIYKRYSSGIGGQSGWSPLGKSLTFGFDAGASFGYYFSDKLGLTLGILYSQQGQKYDTFDRAVRMNYLKVPFQFIFVANTKKAVTFAVSAGIYYSYLLSYSDKNTEVATNRPDKTYEAKGNSYTVKTGSVSVSTGFINGNPYKSYDLGGIVALGLQIRLSSRMSVPILLTYEYGFMDIKNKDCKYRFEGSADEKYFWKPGGNEDPNAGTPYHNSSVKLSVGLKLTL